MSAAYDSSVALGTSAAPIPVTYKSSPRSGERQIMSIFTQVIGTPTAPLVITIRPADAPLPVLASRIPLSSGSVDALLTQVVNGPVILDIYSTTSVAGRYIVQVQ